jgi:hypothetical protein
MERRLGMRQRYPRPCCRFPTHAALEPMRRRGIGRLLRAANVIRQLAVERLRRRERPIAE